MEKFIHDVDSFVKRLESNSIDAYYVFDGNTKGLKNSAHAKRKKEQERRVEKHEDLETKIKELEAIAEKKGYKPELMMVDNDLAVRPRKSFKMSRLHVADEDTEVVDLLDSLTGNIDEDEDDEEVDEAQEALKHAEE